MEGDIITDVGDGVNGIPMILGTTDTIRTESSFPLERPPQAATLDRME